MSHKKAIKAATPEKDFIGKRDDPARRCLS